MELKPIRVSEELLLSATPEQIEQMIMDEVCARLVAKDDEVLERLSRGTGEHLPVGLLSVK